MRSLGVLRKKLVHEHLVAHICGHAVEARVGDRIGATHLGLGVVLFGHLGPVRGEANSREEKQTLVGVGIVFFAHPPRGATPLHSFWCPSNRSFHYDGRGDRDGDSDGGSDGGGDGGGDGTCLFGG